MSNNSMGVEVKHIAYRIAYSAFDNLAFDSEFLEMIHSVRKRFRLFLSLYLQEFDKLTARRLDVRKDTKIIYSSFTASRRAMFWSLMLYIQKNSGVLMMETNCKLFPLREPAHYAIPQV